jgi:transposase
MAGAPIHTEARRLVMRMLMLHPYHKVAEICGISESSVRRIAKVFEITGSIDPIPGQVKRGRKPILDDGDHEVSAYPLTKRILCLSLLPLPSS